MTTLTSEPRSCDRHDPLGRSDYLSVEHVERYRFAASVLRSGRVLDLAAGAGYGSAMLRASDLDVVSGDTDPFVLASSRRRFGGPHWIAADALALPFGAGVFDAAVCFETIEHVVEGRQLLHEMRRVLRPGGTYVCSTPNIAYTAHPDYHVKEYRPAEFYDLVGEVFGDVERHAQYFRARDRVRDLYSWHLQKHVLAAADAVGVRPLVKKARRRRAGEAEPAGPSPQSRIDHVLAGAADPDHGVCPYRGDRWLRIMVTVARRDG